MLPASPRSFLDVVSGRPAFGSYEGPLPPVVLRGAGARGALGLRDRVGRQKRWVYAAIVTGEAWLAFAVVRTGYASTAFAFAYDRQGKRMFFDRTVLGPASLAHVNDDPHAAELARFVKGKTKLAWIRRGAGLDVTVRMDDLEIDAVIDEASGPPGITAISDLGGGLVSGTEKRVLLGVRGRARCGQREIDLDGGSAGYDYTQGLLPRHTAWRWAYAMGETRDGEPFGFNVVQGFVGAAECAAFTGAGVAPIAEPRFDLDPAAPMRPWRLTGDGIDLTFEPGGVHAQRTNLLVVRSRFVQPVGTFTGVMRVAGRELHVVGMPGVVEDQDVFW